MLKEVKILDMVDLLHHYRPCWRISVIVVASACMEEHKRNLKRLETWQEQNQKYIDKEE